MTLRPTVSKVIGHVKDPALSQVQNSEIESSIPQTQVRELDSVLAMNSGEIVVVGGLIDKTAKNDKNSIPGANKIPLLGSLFSSRAEEKSTTELVIFLKATVL